MSLPHGSPAIHFLKIIYAKFIWTLNTLRPTYVQWSVSFIWAWMLKIISKLELYLHKSSSVTLRHSHQGASLPLSFPQSTFSSSFMLPVSLSILCHSRFHLQDSGMSNTAHFSERVESPLSFSSLRSLALFKNEHKVSIFILNFK